MVIIKPFEGTKVTRKRLYPFLEDIIRDLHSTNTGGTIEEIGSRLESALRAYVYDRMPIRLLIASTMELLEREEIIQHIKQKMAFIDEPCLALMFQAIDRLSQRETTQSERREDDPEEEDVREDPENSIFTFLFSKFAGYAILSHTWLHGLQSEIRYQDTLAKDWQSKNAKRAGYQKIKKFCSTVQQHDISLAWVDTICINKDSSAELDESIRSMYQWYHRSSLCITYLHQTSISVDKKRQALKSSGMQHDKWFTRGWTLQELLAPRLMKFYDKDWQAIRHCANDKKDIAIQELVSEVTGIEPDDITSFHPITTCSSIMERMLWATKRSTTRGEDRAYALMGVFGVSLSIAYGEGPERAFFRLVEAIITSRDTSQIIQILACAGKPVSDEIHPSRLIPSSPECYLDGDGRTAEGTRYDTSDFVQTAKAIARMCCSYPLSRRAMTLTHLGLQVQLLLVRIKPQYLKCYDTNGKRMGPGPYTVSLSCTIQDGSDSTQVKYAEQDIYLERKFPYRVKSTSEICATHGPHSFFLGIYTFTEDTTHFSIPPSYCAFLLAVPLSNSEKDSILMKDLTSDRFTPSTKINTRSVLRIDNNLGSKVVCVKKSKYRNTMKVLTFSL